MVEYKLTYLDVTGYGEVIRFIFALAKVPFTDVRLPLDFQVVPPKLDEKLKQTLPWGQVPILEFNGTILAQSSAISRFVARKFGFCGENEIEAAQCDEFVDAVKDYTDVFRTFIIMKEGEEKEKAKENFVDVVAPTFFNRLNGKLEGRNWLVGCKVSWADLYAVNFIRLTERCTNIQLTDGFKNVLDLIDRVYAIPEIKKWRDQHPNA